MPKTETSTWRDQVMREHHELNAHLASLRSFLDQQRPEIGRPGSHTWAAELSRGVVTLHDMLFRHFRFEEEGGMVEEIARAHPRATRQAEEIVDEHAAILKRIRRLTAALLSYSEGRSPEDPGLRRRLTALLDSLAEHERVENDFILGMELDDLGLGD